MRLTLASRWVQLAIGVFVMMTISSPQFVWTLFAKPFQQATNSSLAAVQVTFTLLIVLQTFFAPLQGFLVERTSPRLMISVGAVLNGVGWLVASQAHSLFSVYAGYGVLCGLGTGIVYIGVIGLMVRWFPNLRGLAVGLVAAGYGIGAMLTTFPISNMIATEGFRPTLRTFGLILAALGVAGAAMLRNPEASGVADHYSPTIESRAKDLAPGEMLRTPLFWLMFTMMAMIANRWIDGDRSVCGVCARIRCRRRGGVRLRADSLRVNIRPYHERTDEAVLRLRIRSYRSRELHGAGIHPRGCRGLPFVSLQAKIRMPSLSSPALSSSRGARYFLFSRRC